MDPKKWVASLENKDEDQPPFPCLRSGHQLFQR